LVVSTPASLFLDLPVHFSSVTVVLSTERRETRRAGDSGGRVGRPRGLRAHSAELFTLIAAYRLAVDISGRHPLAEAAAAHRDLESRGTGKLLLLP
jgi:NADPH:quinone reductase-like Zn-dependent oxidoreductase